MSQRKRVSCKLCDWSRPLWAGKRNGFDSLRLHMAEEHPKQFSDMLMRVHGPGYDPDLRYMAPDRIGLEL